MHTHTQKQRILPYISKVFIYIRYVRDVKKHSGSAAIPDYKLNIAYVRMKPTGFIHNACHVSVSLETSKATQTYYHVPLSLNQRLLHLHLLPPRATALFCVSHQLYEKTNNTLKENDINAVTIGYVWRTL